MGYMVVTTISKVQIDGLVVLIATVVICWLGIVVICCSAQDMEQKLKWDIGLALKTLENSKMSKSSIYLMNYFLTHVLRNFKEVNFGGYIRVGKGLLSTLSYNYLANLVVIVQLHLRSSVIENARDLYDLRSALFQRE
ncbi:uncharacterized protein LOC132197886 [Neocloeon triangulifer]|uniref:uncharacterized protein LOC132197886 n=1 Tax=Neocloeon triangulifer TaxID=2078957 RepID=UPI00286F3F14|nr:uncharacterized protein LOC132197886 [Neocloeon triangulifer]